MVLGTLLSVALLEQGWHQLASRGPCQSQPLWGSLQDEKDLDVKDAADEKSPKMSEGNIMANQPQKQR